MSKEPNGLPPLVADVSGGDVVWERLEGIDFEFLGYLLTCHLVIEHYLDEYLKSRMPGLNWDEARLTFRQRLALLSDMGVDAPYDPIPAIARLNALRNKLGHRVNYQVTDEDLKPLMDHLRGIYTDKRPVPTDRTKVLSQFTSMACAVFAGALAGTVKSRAPRTG